MSREFSLLEPKANLFSTISAIERIVQNFKSGVLSPSVYKKQLVSLLRDFYDLTTMLSRSGFNVDRFYHEEHIFQRFPQAIERINNKQLVSTEIATPKQQDETLTRSTSRLNLKLAANTAKLVSCYITIGDSARLKSVTTKEMLVPLFDECLLLLPKMHLFDQDYWVPKEIEKWRGKMEQMELKKTLADTEAEQLAYNADRWLRDLQLRLNLEYDQEK